MPFFQDKIVTCIIRPSCGILNVRPGDGVLPVFNGRSINNRCPGQSVRPALSL